MINQKRPDSIDSKQIDGKENHSNQGNDRRVLYFVGGRPRHSPHFRARIMQKLRGALNKARPRAGLSALT